MPVLSVIVKFGLLPPRQPSMTGRPAAWFWDPACPLLRSGVLLGCCAAAQASVASMNRVINNMFFIRETSTKFCVCCAFAIGTSVKSYMFDDVACDSQQLA